MTEEKDKGEEEKKDGIGEEKEKGEEEKKME